MTNNQQNVEIKNSITGEVVSSKLSDAIPQNTIDQLYEALNHLRLKGPVLAVQKDDQLLTEHECKDYADDFLYDKQQCQLYFSNSLWENFSLQDAAIFLSHLHVFSISSFYSAMPFLFEIALRADKWSDSFYALVVKLRNEAKQVDVELWRKLGLEAAQVIVKFLEMLSNKAEKLEKYEDVTVINRTITLWKSNMQQIFK